MKLLTDGKQIMDRSIEELKKAYQFNNSIMDEIVLANLKRIFVFSIVAIPMQLIIAIFFIFAVSSGSANESQWRTALIILHISMSVLFSLCLFPLQIWNKKDIATKTMHLFQYGMIVFYLFSGVIITVIDQLVTPSITPYFLICVFVSTILYLRPAFSILVYSGTFILFYFLIGIYQVDSAALASNRINGFAASVLGGILSVILWKANALNIHQRQIIALQNQVLEEKNRELFLFASYDPLTGLLRRKQFTELVNKKIAAMDNNNCNSCIIIMDIDFFKELNDTYGHPGGDTVLKEIGILISENTRKTDLVARWGGEEFVIFLPQTSIEEGQQRAEELRKAIEKTAFMIDEYEVHITVSLGIAPLYRPVDANIRLNEFEACYTCADKALYRAKQTGRNRTVSYTICERNVTPS